MCGQCDDDVISDQTRVMPTYTPTLAVVFPVACFLINSGISPSCLCLWLSVFLPLPAYMVVLCPYLTRLPACIYLPIAPLQVVGTLYPREREREREDIICSCHLLLLPWTVHPWKLGRLCIGIHLFGKKEEKGGMGGIMP